MPQIIKTLSRIHTHMYISAYVSVSMNLLFSTLICRSTFKYTDTYRRHLLHRILLPIRTYTAHASTHVCMYANSHTFSTIVFLSIISSALLFQQYIRSLIGSIVGRGSSRRLPSSALKHICLE